MTLENIYNFFFNYKINSEIAAFLRVASYGWIVSHWIYRFKDFYLFSKPNGIFNNEIWSNYTSSNNHNSFGYLLYFNKLADSNVFHKFLFFGFFVFGAFSTIGFLTNISGFLFFLCFISLSQRLSLINGCAGDIFAKLIIFCLMLVDTGAKYSLDSYLGISSNSLTVDAWSFRIIQIALCTCYIFSSWHKIEDDSWKNGTAMPFSMVNKNWSRLDEFFFPKFIRNIYINIFTKSRISLLLGYLVIIAEYSIPFLYMISNLRIYGVCLAILFHIGTLIFLRLGHFAITLIIANLFFLGSF
jgi:hypothetical protein